MRYKVYSVLPGISFKKNEKKNSWELIRKSRQYKAYGVERSIEAYEKNCNMRVDYKTAAETICRYLARGCSIVSCGVGKGILEYHIKEISPQNYLCCTDFTQDALEMLKKVFISCDEFKVFDMKNDDWQELNKYDVVIFYRVQTEFSFKQWQIIFENMAKSKIKNIVFVPGEMSGVKTFCKDLGDYVKNLYERGGVKEGVVCYKYSEWEYLRMWKVHYALVRKVSFNDTAAYFLRIKKGI